MRSPLGIQLIVNGKALIIRAWAHFARRGPRAGLRDGFQWIPISSGWIAMDSHASGWISMEFYGFHASWRASMEFYGFPCFGLDFYGIL